MKIQKIDHSTKIICKILRYNNLILKSILSFFQINKYYSQIKLFYFNYVKVYNCIFDVYVKVKL